jgi:hypothetical protein
VVLTAAAGSGYTFSGWSGSGVSCAGTGSCTVSMTAARTVTATFSQTAASNYTLNVSLTGTGSVTSSPSGINCGSACSASYASGTSVVLTAAAGSGYTFSGWSGSGVSCAGTGSCTVSMTAARTVTAVFGPSGGGGSGTPGATRPHLWLNSATVTRLRSAAQANSAEWSKLKSFCDANLNAGVPGWDYQGDQKSRYVSNFALCYRIVKEVSGQTAADPYGQKALQILNNDLIPFTNYGNDSGYGIRNYVPGISIAYDWLYDYSGLTETVKTSARNRIKAWLNWYQASGYANNEVISNYNSGFMLARVLSSISIYGDDAESATLFSAAVSHYNTARNKFDQVMPGGHWPEGWNYGAGVLERYAMAASALKISTSDANYAAFSWLTNNVTLKLNAVSPDGKYFYDDGGWTGSSAGIPSMNDMIAEGFLAGWSTNAGKIARSYIDNINVAPAYEAVDEWKSFLYFDPASQPYNLATTNKSYHATGAGLVTMRSAWSSPTGTWASFIAGPYLSYQEAQNMDQGQIMLYKKAPLLIDASHDLYGDAHLTDTIHHNTYTLENRSGTSYAGQNEYAVSSSCPGDTIGINSYLDGGTWMFTSGEFANAYKTQTCGSPGIKRLQRNIFYLRPNLLLVYDQIEKLANQLQVAPRMHLHFPTQPATLDFNRQLTVDNAGARLHVATVFPLNAMATLEPNSVSGSVTPGWHLAVTAPDQTASYQRFLHVLRAGEATSAYTFPDVRAISSSAAYGAQVSNLTTAESTEPLVIVFADNGTTSIPSSLNYQYVPVAGQTRHYVLKLKPNTSYSVSSTTAGSNVAVTLTEGGSGYQSDSAGVLSFLL